MPFMDYSGQFIASQLVKFKDFAKLLILATEIMDFILEKKKYLAVIMAITTVIIVTMVTMAIATLIIITLQATIVRRDAFNVVAIITITMVIARDFKVIIALKVESRSIYSQLLFEDYYMLLSSIA